ncbi:uncharacterized protein LOC132187481 [Corylus avellana]|uniref:uncharacterized protein LOC132187481 n=1 Tax=Corylus avellana TaxID=13451 RepID=UPI00286C854C|nr:uncharacterized protein LOC132187481 [Corylus avellana]
MFRTMLERIITFLQVSKNNILPNIKEKLGSYEKQILNFINAHRPRKPVSSLPQPQSQFTQKQSHENQMNLQGSAAALDSTSQTGRANGGDWQETASQEFERFEFEFHFNSMDTNNWRPNPIQAHVGGGGGPGAVRAGGGGEPTMDTGDWRIQLPLDSRQRVVNKIMDTLKRHLPTSGEEGLHELKKIATRFEEKIYAAASSQSDYLRKISLKMLTMETKSQNPIGNSLPSNAAGSSNNPRDSVSLDFMAQTGHANGGDWQETASQEFERFEFEFHVNSLDNNNWRPNPSQAPVGRGGGPGPGSGGAGGRGEPTIDTGDWRTQLPLNSRQRIVSKITETLKRHLPISGEEGLHELKKIATRFEEKIYAAASSQSDYLRKISLKMLTMETKSQNPIGNSLPSNAAGSSNNPPDSVSLDFMAQTRHANGGDWRETVSQEIKAVKEMLESFEKQILDFIDTNRPRSPVSSLQQGQLSPPHVHPMQQPHENQMNSQLQSMNLQGSVAALDSTAQTGCANGG